jgi:hypothetical protein
MVVDPRDIRAKFGDDYVATDDTFRLGIDTRFTKHFAARFIGRVVLETCTGAGFTTIALAEGFLDSCPPFDSAFLDPDWAVSGPGHMYRFRNSNMRPPADLLLRSVLARTHDVAIVLPPLVDTGELADLPPHECERLFLGAVHELYCLYFGTLARTHGPTEWRQ